MRKSKRKGLQAPEAIGYHGTRLEYAQKILDEDFRPSENSWEWLGHGVYFWQDAPDRAFGWAKEWHSRSGYEGPIAVVAARIQLFDFVDLLDQTGMRLVKDFASALQRKIANEERSLTNEYPIHRLDCELFNSVTTMLLSEGIEVRGYRAACVEGDPITEGSPIYDRSHVQLAVIDQTTILEKWIIEDVENPKW